LTRQPVKDFETFVKITGSQTSENIILHGFELLQAMVAFQKVLNEWRISGSNN